MASMQEQELDSSYGSIFDPTTLVRRGLCPVSRLRHQSGDPFSLYFEQHGSGPEKILFIMGWVNDASITMSCLTYLYSLNSSSFAWSTQVDHFGRLPGYTSLVYDNRGVGHSSSPKGPYTYASCVLFEYTTVELTSA